jgi:cytochrome c
MRCDFVSVLSFVLLTACGPEQQQVATTVSASPRELANAAGDQRSRAAAAYLSAPEFEDADLDRGALLSLACQACHSLETGQPDLIGPNLYDLFETSSANSDTFSYSEAMLSADLLWTPDVLDAWLTDPDEFLPGTNMVFAGYNSDIDRRDLIAFLLHKTSGLDR